MSCCKFHGVITMNNQNNNFKRKIASFFVGRYGNDQLNRFLLIVCAILCVINAFFFSPAAYAVELATLVWCVFRMTSRNFTARHRENDTFLLLSAPVTKFWKKRIVPFFRLCKNRFRDRKTHVYRVCPHCGAVLRLPRRKGKHSVCCPACKKSFNVRIFR